MAKVGFENLGGAAVARPYLKGVAGPAQGDCPESIRSFTFQSVPEPFPADTVFFLFAQGDGISD